MKIDPNKLTPAQALWWRDGGKRFNGKPEDWDNLTPEWQALYEDRAQIAIEASGRDALLVSIREIIELCYSEYYSQEKVLRLARHGLARGQMGISADRINELINKDLSYESRDSSKTEAT